MIKEVALKLSDRDHELIKKAADEQGFSMAAYIVTSVLKNLDKSAGSGAVTFLKSRLEKSA